MPKMTGAQALVGQLRSEGVDTVFTVPGVQIMAVIDALYPLRDDIRLVQARHEQATTYMADGYAKVTGKPGVAMVVPGPGVLNAAAGLGTAYASSSPVLLISGQIPTASLGKRKGDLHEIEDQLDVFKPITKWNHRATRVEEVPEAVHEAFRQLQTGRPRPVELEFPSDTVTSTGEAEFIEPEEYPRLKADPSEVERAAQMLLASKSPAIIAGGGARISDAGRELVELAEYLQAPVMTTQNAKGVIPEDHPMSIGVNYDALGPCHRVLPESDLLLAVGTRLLIKNFEMPSSCKVVHVDVDPDELGRNHATELGIHADAREALGQLLQHLRSASQPKDSRAGQIEGYKKAFQEEVRQLASEQADMNDTIRALLGDDGILVSGISNIGYWGHVFYPVKNPRAYLTSSYYATLGFAFPTALGAKWARPESHVAAVCGDGGFMYSPQELSTAVKYGLNVVALVFNDNAYGASKWDQTHRYERHYYGTDLLNPDFVKLAESFGALGMRTNPAGLGETLREALSANAPVVLEVVVPTMMPPFQIVPQPDPI